MTKIDNQPELNLFAEHPEDDQNFLSGIVALIGPPNAGKSTLLNSFLGEKVAIVTPKPQTTRNQISGILTRSDAQIVFLDTPGVHKSPKTLNRFLVDTAWQALKGADCILLVLDSELYAKKPQRLEQDIAYLQKPIQRSALPVIIALNKVDLLADKKKLLPLMEQLQQLWPEAEVFPVSAATGRGIQELLTDLSKHLPQGPALYPEDQISTLPLRFMAAEIIREKLFFHLDKELPYSVAVEISLWEEDPEKDLVSIQATIFVAHKNHKKIVIGKGGQNLKNVGQEARLELQEILQGRVFLELWVKVRAKWNEDIRFISSLVPEV